MLIARAAWIVVIQASQRLQGYMQPDDTVLSPKWYEGLRKPSWTPPPWAFPLAWIPLKLLQTIAAAMIWETEEARVFSSPAVLLFVVHLALGDVWNIQFFAKQRLLTGLLTIVAFWLMLGSATVAFCVANPVAGALLVPSVVWVAVATSLNLDVWYLNK